MRVNAMAFERGGRGKRCEELAGTAANIEMSPGGGRELLPCICIAAQWVPLERIFAHAAPLRVERGGEPHRVCRLVKLALGLQPCLDRRMRPDCLAQPRQVPLRNHAPM